MESGKSANVPGSQAVRGSRHLHENHDPQLQMEDVHVVSKTSEQRYMNLPSRILQDPNDYNPGDPHKRYRELARLYQQINRWSRCPCDGHIDALLGWTGRKVGPVGPFL